jgi:hypothetical protein
MPYRIILIAAALAVAGCSNASGDKPVKTRQQRMAETEAMLNKGPSTRTHKVDGGELRVIETPVSEFPGIVETQRCFVWRDTEFKTASISCPQPPGGVVLREE